MKIWYEHPFGVINKANMQIVKVFATVEPEEQEQALSQGFIEKPYDVWQQVRSTRVDIKEYIAKAKPIKQHKDVTVTKWSGEFAQANRDILIAVYDEYILKKGYIDHFIFNEYTFTSKDVFYIYSHDDRVNAWSVWTKYGQSVENWQFAWNYYQPNLKLGNFSLDHEIRIAHEKNYRYFYLSEGYDASSKWKAELPGFQWWDGKTWNKDVGRFAFYCDAEDGATQLSDIMDVYENPCTREKFWNRRIKD